MANILRSIMSGIDDLATGAASKTISGIEGMFNKVGSSEARLRNKHPLISSSTANQRTIAERRTTHYNQSLYDRVIDPEDTAKFVDVDTAANIKDAGGNIFEVSGWGPSGPAGAAYKNQGGKSFITMGEPDAAAFNVDINTGGPTRGEGFMDWLSGSNQRRLKPDAELDALMAKESRINRLANLPSTADDVAARANTKTTMGQGATGPEGGIPAEPVTSPLGAQAPKFETLTMEGRYKIFNDWGRTSMEGSAASRQEFEAYLEGVNRSPMRGRLAEAPIQGGLAEAPTGLAEASTGLAEGSLGININRPIDPDMFFDRATQGQVWGSRLGWIGTSIAGVAVAGSIAQGQMQGEDEESPTMIGGGQGMQGRSF